MINFCGKTIIGHYTVYGPSRLMHRCPSYYAADSETYFRVPGTYPIYLSFKFVGWEIPMPKIVVHCDCYSVEKKYYSGFCGVNFGCTTDGPGPTRQEVWSPYSLDTMVEQGTVTLLPDFEFFGEDYGSILDHCARLWEIDVDRRISENPKDFRAKMDKEALDNRRKHIESQAHSSIAASSET